MRKEDRVRMSQQQDRSREGSDSQMNVDPRGREQMTGRGSSDQPPKPQKQPGGKLPLPVKGR